MYLLPVEKLEIWSKVIGSYSMSEHTFNLSFHVNHLIVYWNCQLGWKLVVPVARGWQGKFRLEGRLPRPLLEMDREDCSWLWVLFPAWGSEDSHGSLLPLYNHFHLEKWRKEQEKRLYRMQIEARRSQVLCWTFEAVEWMHLAHLMLWFYHLFPLLFSFC